MIRQWRVALFFILSFLLCSNLLAANFYTYEGTEHITFGDEVKIYLHPGDQGRTAYELHLPNQLMATYGDIISFGDFYEIPNVAISSGKSLSEREALFLSAFQTFANSQMVVGEAYQIMDILHTTKKTIEDAIARGEDPEKVYQKIGNDTNRQLNCVTGGGCMSGTWYLTQGRYLKLANSDFDHFGDRALTTYIAGHELALQQALIAHQSNNPDDLELAYAMNAFASHFLSDRFASGHLRTPRTKLNDKVSPATVGSLLSNYMHNEENYYGLHVYNHRGDHWVAFGDRAYFSARNQMNRDLLKRALQVSADEIFYAYQYGSLKTNEVESLVPYAVETKRQANQDIAPLFYWDTAKNALMRRSDVSNVHDRHWTSSWWGWSTLALLGKTYGMPQATQAKLATPALADEAMKQGLITDPTLLKARQR